MTAYEECPKFLRCAVNKCPLDPKYKERRPHPDDRETVCRLEKEVRVFIGSKYDNLPYDGMIGDEYKMHKRWHTSPETQMADQ